MGYWDKQHLAEELAVNALHSIEFLSAVELIQEIESDLAEDEVEEIADEVLAMAKQFRLTL